MRSYKCKKCRVPLIDKEFELGLHCETCGAVYFESKDAKRDFERLKADAIKKIPMISKGFKEEISGKSPDEIAEIMKILVEKYWSSVLISEFDENE